MIIRNIRRISKVLYPIIANNNYAFKSTQLKTANNPFIMKTLPELQKMLQVKHIQSSKGTYYGLILKAVCQKTLSRDVKHQGKIKLDEQIAIINKCLNLVLSNMEQADYVSCLYLVQVFCSFQDSKNIRISQKNFLLFQDKFAKRIAVLVGKQQARQHLQQLYAIFFKLLEIRRRGIISNKLVAYLIDQQLSSNQQILEFLQNFLKANINRCQFPSIENIIKRYINNLQLDSSSPKIQTHDLTYIILESVHNNSLFFRPIYQTHIRKYVYWLQQQFKKNSRDIKIHVKIKLLHQMIYFMRYLPIYSTQNDQIHRHAQFLEWLFIEINQQIEKQFVFRLQFLDNYIEIIRGYKILMNNYMWSVTKTPQQVYRETQRLANIIVLKSIESSSKYKYSQIVTLINDIAFAELPISLETQQKFAHYCLDFVAKSSKNRVVSLPVIRILQYITLAVLEHRINIDKTIIQTAFKKIQQFANNLYFFQLIRLYAISQNLGIHSKIIRQYFQHKKQKDHYQAVQNLSRTYLKTYSLGQIKKICRQAIQQRTNKNISRKDNDYQNCNLITVSFKSPKFLIEDSNQMFKFWFHENFDFLKQILQNQNNAEYIIRFINKQFLKSKVFPSIKAQFQLEVFYMLRSSATSEKKRKNIDRNIQELLRPLIRLSKIKEIFGMKYRYSFFPKLIWLYRLNYERPDILRQQFRIHDITRQLMHFIRQDKSMNTVQYQCLKKKLVWKIMKKQLEYPIEVLAPSLSEFWFWANNNYMMQSQKMFEDHHTSLYYTCAGLIRKQYSSAEQLEFMLGNFFSNKIPQELEDSIQSQYQWGLFNISNYERTQPMNVQQLLNLYTYKNCIRYLASKNKHFIPYIIEQTIKIEQYLGYTKCLQIWRIFDEFSWVMQIDLREKILYWLYDQIDQIQKLTPDRYCQVYLKTRMYQLGKPISPILKQFITSNIKDGNFYYIQILLQLHQLIQTQDVYTLIQSLYYNRSVIFLADIFQNQCLNLINKIFSLVLLKKDNQVTQRFCNLCLMMLQNINYEQINNDLIIQFTLRLSLASSLVGQPQQVLELKKKIFQQTNTNQQSICKMLNNKQLKLIQTKNLVNFTKTFHYQKISAIKISLLKNKSNYVLINDNKSMAENTIQCLYLQKYHHIEHIVCMDSQDFVQSNPLVKNNL